jgi:DNA-nicking Smr family endonuclease
MPPKKPPPQKSPLPDDVDLFREMMSGVKPIIAKEKITPPASPAPKLQRQSKIDPVPELADGMGGGIDRNTHEKFRRGDMPIESRLDLHGRTLDQSFAAVEQFIHSCHAAGKRCVLIITGKGREKTEADIFEQRGVLRQSLPQWLNHASLRPKILAFCQAQRRDGGNGAFYVLLKRQRS